MNALRQRVSVPSAEYIANFLSLYLACGLALAGSVIAFGQSRPEAYFAACIAIQFSAAWGIKPPFDKWEV